MFIEAPAVSAAFTGTGGAGGSILMGSSTGFYAGATAYITDSTGTRNVRALIVGVPDATHVVARIVADDNEQQLAKQIYGAGSNLTAYTVANTSTIWMPAQLVKVEPTTTAPTKLNV